ncbi:MAG: hypothetical protein AAF292_15525 [Pseudomonadota bacterium]
MAVSNKSLEGGKIRTLRLLAVVLALSLMIGELWRSWGAGRPIAFIMDDQIMGAMLLTGAALMQRPTVRRRAFFSAGWAVNAGMLYGSFFGKVFAPQNAEAGNWDLGILTVLIGVAFATAIIGLLWSIFAIPAEEQGSLT